MEAVFRHFIPIVVRGLLIGLFLAPILLMTHAGAADKSYTKNGDVFVLQTSVKQTVKPEPVQQGPGIVGLDMLISPQAYPVIQQVFPGTPAARNGLRPGDVIVGVDGTSTYDKSDYQVDVMISDVPGTPVRLTIQRGGITTPVTLTVAPQQRLSSR